jgi:hypothetical protein
VTTGETMVGLGRIVGVVTTLSGGASNSIQEAVGWRLSTLRGESVLGL